MISALIDTEGIIVFLNKIHKGFNRGNKELFVDHTTLDGNLYRYSTSSYFKATIPIDFVSSIDAAQILNWWRDRSQIGFDEFATQTGQNLIINGNAEQGSNTNFSDFSITSVSPYSGGYSHVYSASGSSSRRNDDYIPINVLQMYQCNAAIRTSVSGTTVLLGFSCYDENFELIRSFESGRRANSETQLYLPVSDGSIYADIVPPTSGSWGTTGWIQFGVSSDFSDLPNFAIESVGSLDTTLSSSYWRISINGAVDSTYESNSLVGFHGGGGAFIYTLYNQSTPSSDWQFLTSSISGVNSYHVEVSASDKNIFFRGTKYIKFTMQVVGGTESFLDEVIFNPINFAKGISSLYISNRSKPLSRVYVGQIEYWRGTIELESF